MQLTVTWIGQAGFFIRHGGKNILIDPYLSDSVGAIDPSKHRRIPVDPTLFEIKPDIMIFTHDHLDHYDPETASHYLQNNDRITVLAPASVWTKVRKEGKLHNYVQFDRGTIWTEHGIRFTAVKATHSDPYAIGVILDDGQKKFYFTGDTLYNEAIFADLPEDLYAVFFPVNGVGNNMNMTDAASFARRTNTKVAVPVHYGMFDDINIELFDLDNKKILTTYQETEL